MTDDLTRLKALEAALRSTTQEMATTCSVPMELWDRHSNAVLEAADALPSLLARIERVEGELRGFDWIAIAQKGFADWASKEHNARWARKIDGTPIPNDLTICIGQAFKDARDANVTRPVLATAILALEAPRHE